VNEKKEIKKEKIMLLIVATTFATQPVYNAAWAAHALRSDQCEEGIYNYRWKIFI
jgi:hypothetical protein